MTKSRLHQSFRVFMRWGMLRELLREFVLVLSLFELTVLVDNLFRSGVTDVSFKNYMVAYSLLMVLSMSMTRNMNGSGVINVFKRCAIILHFHEAGVLHITFLDTMINFSLLLNHTNKVLQIALSLSHILMVFDDTASYELKNLLLSIIHMKTSNSHFVLCSQLQKSVGERRLFV